MIKEAIATLVSGSSLTEEQAASVMEEIMEGKVTPAQFGAFVTALRLKGETVDYNEILNDGQLRDIPKEYCPHLLAEYRDIYERKITTVQEFCIEEQNDYKRVILGDLYFTVNGRRLGEEVIKHD